ncbi:ribonuclease E [Sphingomonas jejuensis]|uniref:Ribonuclease E n=1 Tax=Sphingomonas jejuensis TaxID=904715 RepID=A0ABX0XL29_9SPHN|nr:ribonuclease E/G [Sphingomonas jejuensis]NJC33940.1 ribonuclease E [Sphingomonas jejuensis]
MTTRMLIDARHREETRVAVVQGNRIEEFDFESAERKQLKGNIYLAKVTRVEPSLQAAFVDYGGNRHGFLAFSEIHPDYYQIPKEDRDALLREEAEHAAEEERLHAELDARDEDAGADEDDDAEIDTAEQDDDADEDDDGAERPARAATAASQPEENAAEALRSKRMALRRRYKIQDVIHRRQILLVQVVKEERGNKGAALTTYLSLAGRYCVLMPNTTHGGGISRKISNAADRKRLKSIMAEMNLPKSMGCIVRTAGLQRTKTEIKRDFDYLARLWDGIREDTLKASAPSCIYGDSDLIKRAIRDIYNRDIDEVIVEGERGYRAAKDFMRLLMPSHAKRIKGYADAVPLFQRFGVEDQLNQMYHPVVQLKSGGYLVINPTEALVSIDINSGRSTREHGIEATAVSTNLEAAHEIARQLRLRDMAGLVVIDFIDMENNSNIRKVEKAMKAALAGDRARIQVGRISSFGLMEMSRQRLRTGVLEASTRPCPHCEGSGFVRTASSAGLSALRMIEEEAARGRGSQILLKASQEGAFYVLNHKRAELAEIEERYGVRVEIMQDGEIEGARMTVEAGGPPPAHAPRFDPPVFEEDEDDLAIEDEEIEEEELSADEPDDADEPRASKPQRGREEREERAGRRRRRRRGRRGRDGEDGGKAADAPEAIEADGDVEGAAEPVESDGEALAVGAEPERAADDEGGEKRRRGRRGRRGGRRNRGGDRMDAAEREEAAEAGLDSEPASDEPDLPPVAEPSVPADNEAEPAPAAAELVIAADEDAPAPKRRRSRRKATEETSEAAAPETSDAETPAEPLIATAPAEDVKPKRTRRRKPAETAAAEQPVAEQPAAEAAATDAPEEEAPKPRRRRAPRKAAAEAAEPAAAETTAAAAAPAAAEPEPVATEAISVPEAANGAEAAAPRRGWWQRTFGA